MKSEINQSKIKRDSEINPLHPTSVCIFSTHFLLIFCSLLISSGADEENLFINQGASLVGDHFVDSRDLKCDSGMILLEEIRC